MLCIDNLSDVAVDVWDAELAGAVGSEQDVLRENLADLQQTHTNTPTLQHCSLVPRQFRSPSKTFGTRLTRSSLVTTPFREKKDTIGKGIYIY